MLACKCEGNKVTGDYTFEHAFSTWVIYSSLKYSKQVACTLHVHNKHYEEAIEILQEYVDHNDVQQKWVFILLIVRHLFLKVKLKSVYSN